jgi:hypothetical protein
LPVCRLGVVDYPFSFHLFLVDVLMINLAQND